MMKSGLHINDKLKKISRKKVFTITLLLVIIAGIGVLAGLKFATRNASATLSGWNAGNIMDDPTMANKNSMTLAQIQSFLSSEYPGAKSAPAGTPNGYSVGLAYYGVTYYYHISNGVFVPLSQETFGPNGQPASSGQSAAQIIYNAAQTYSINPQVLIVLLQKESGLITDNWPNSGQYQAATGYGCPDTAACSSDYYGIINQINNAASFYHAILTGAKSGNYPIGNDSILYNPNQACGSSIVNVQNDATNALYTYTPYQPNAAALANPKGTGDNCSAYGNRNFYDYFTDWFGSTQSDVFTPAPGNINITSGVYTITATGNRALDIAGASTSNDTPAVSYTLNGSVSQTWMVTKLPNGYYTLQNVNSGRYLDVFNGSVYNGSSIGLYDGNGGINQQFAIVQNRDSGGYYIQTVVSGRVVDIAGNSYENNTHLDTFTANGTSAQSWNFNLTILPTNGTYQIINPVTGKSLDATGGRVYSNGTPVQLWDAAVDSGAQRWDLTSNGNGTVSITNADSGKSLDVANGLINNDGQGIQLWNNGRGGNQIWNIIAGNNGVSFVNPYSRKVINVSGGAINTPGASINLFTEYGDSSQVWKLTKLQ